MPTESSLRETLEHFRAQEKKLLDDLRSVRLTVRSIERELGIQGQEPDSLDSSDSGSTIDVGVPSASGSLIGGKPAIRPDEFFGLTQADAARRYLKKVGHAVSFDELADQLRQGGCKLSGANAKQVLYISLIRNTRDFVPPRPGFVGLREFYPGGGGRAMMERTAGRKGKRGRPKKARKTAQKLKTRQSSGAEDAKTAPEPKEIPQAVREFMTDKELHSPSEIAAAVSKKLGRAAKVIAIHGTLRNKKVFEEAGGKYRLK
jgi:hypothetical protein